MISTGKSPSNSKPGVALVTGVYGAIGHYVALALAQRGYDVIGLGNQGLRPPQLPGECPITRVNSGVTLSSLRALSRVPSVIVHCAGGSSVGAAIVAPAEDFRRTVTSTADVLEYIRTDCPSACLIYPSSAAVYGCTDVLPMRVGAPAQPSSTYGMHKLLAEKLIQDRAHNTGVRAVIIRLFSVYGEGFRKQLLWDASQKMMACKFDFFGTGDESRDWLHVTDAAMLIAQAIPWASTQCPIANGGYGEHVTVKAVLAELMRHLAPDEAPHFCGTVRLGDPFHLQADISSAKNWGWTPRIDWASGIERYAKWFLQQRADSGKDF